MLYMRVQPAPGDARMHRVSVNLSAILDEVLAGVDFTHPVELADVVDVHARIRARLPAEARLESYHRHRDVIFEARLGEDLIRRTKEVL